MISAFLAAWSAMMYVKVDEPAPVGAGPSKS